jgi:hypothetical protein
MLTGTMKPGDGAKHPRHKTTEVSPMPENDTATGLAPERRKVIALAGMAILLEQTWPSPRQSEIDLAEMIGELLAEIRRLEAENARINTVATERP